ncbi:MAG: glucosaminidase domain-containing protein [Magnetococcales bacterium]|nr:glucosaminidase domain-containing protein [Magnetococcales bacterium]
MSKLQTFPPKPKPIIGFALLLTLLVVIGFAYTIPQWLPRPSAPSIPATASSLAPVSTAPAVVSPSADVPISAPVPAITTTPVSATKPATSKTSSVLRVTSYTDPTPPTLVTDPEALPDFASITDIKLKKQRFFQFMLTFIEDENKRLSAIRQRLLTLQEQNRHQEPLEPADEQWLIDLGNTYKISPLRKRDRDSFYTILLRRVDQLPPSMVLAQAANESAWGQSRFATQGNNLFGQWCYIPGCGFVPRKRSSDLLHEVSRYTSVRQSVNAYFLNINTHPAYAPLRRLRKTLRQNKPFLSGLELSQELTPYSQRGHDYVSSIQSLIRSNKLSRFDSPPLDGKPNKPKSNKKTTSPSPASPP